MASYFKRTISGILFLSAAGVGSLHAELLELKPHKTTYNLQSKLGLPISATFGDPVGSNGLAPTSDATPGQFTGFYSAGAVVAIHLAFIDDITDLPISPINVQNLVSVIGECYYITFGDGLVILKPQPNFISIRYSVCQYK